MGAAVCVLVGSAVEARADDLTKEQCIEANESGQALRHDGKLRAARVQLLSCQAKNCPGPVRDDCVERMAEVERAAPTIVFTARGPAGNSLRAVHVTMDGTRLADHLDGSALVVDPGEHVFALAADGYASVSKKLVIREGVKGRKELVTFKPTEPPREPDPLAVAAPLVVAKPEPPRSESSGSDQRTVAYVLGGAGTLGLGLGTIFIVSAERTYNDATKPENCPKSPTVCNQAGRDGIELAQTEQIASGIAFGVGGALLVTGVVLLLTAPKDVVVSLRPIVGRSNAGIQLGGSW